MNRVLLSSFLNLAIFSAIFFAFDHYDHNYSLYKIVLFAFLLLLIPDDRKALIPQSIPPRANRLEVTLLLSIAIIVGAFSIFARLESINTPRLSDMSQEVTLAVHRFFRFGANPYEYPGQVPLGFVANYRYGPMLLFGYFGALLHVTNGVIFANIILLALVVLVIISLHLVILPKETYSRTTSALYSAIVLLIPARFWFELFQRGAADLFDPFVFCIALLFVEKKRWMSLGVCAGILLSSKIALGIALVFSSFRKGVLWGFLRGLLIGLLPLLFFILWNPEAYYQSFIRHQWEKGFDNTSIYSLVSESYHPIITVFPWIVAAIVVARRFRTPITTISVLVTSIKILIIFEVFYRHVHGNHLVWLVPPIAIALSLCRHSQLSRFFPSAMEIDNTRAAKR